LNTTPNVFDNVDEENFDLVAKVVELINIIGWNDDDTYTFADGDRWAKFEVDPNLTPTFKVNEVEGYKEPKLPKEIDND